MSALPRPLTGLAAAALTVGLLVTPVLAYAEPTATPTPTPTPTESATATPSSSPTASGPAELPSAGATPTATESGSPSAESTASPSSTATPEPSESEASDAGRFSSDAVGAPEPLAEESPADQVRAQAEGAAITLSKRASRASVSRIGQVITYTFAARNTGSVPLDDVRITDELDGLRWSDCDQGATLAAGATLRCTATLTVTQEWLDFGSIDNSATVFGSYPIEESPESDYVGANASAHVSVEQRPSIALKAAVNPTGTVDRGDRLRYTATATNTGNVTLTSARITSSLSSLDLDCEPSARATLAPGETVSCSGGYTVRTADARKGRVANELTARANGPYDDQRPTDDVTLRTKVTKLASSSDPGLADTGSSDRTLPVGLLGVAAVAAGGWLVRRGARA